MLTWHDMTLYICCDKISEIFCSVEWVGWSGEGVEGGPVRLDGTRGDGTLQRGSRCESRGGRVRRPELSLEGDDVQRVNDGHHRFQKRRDRWSCKCWHQTFSRDLCLPFKSFKIKTATKKSTKPTIFAFWVHNELMTDCRFCLQFLFYVRFHSHFVAVVFWVLFTGALFVALVFFKSIWEKKANKLAIAIVFPILNLVLVVRDLSLVPYSDAGNEWRSHSSMLRPFLQGQSKGLHAKGPR